MRKPKPDDLDAALAAALTTQAAAAQTTLERKADVDASKRALEILREERDAFARQTLRAGERLDEDEAKRHAVALMLAGHEVETQTIALNEALAQAHAAGVEAKRALWRVKAREAKRLRAGEGRSYIALQDATDKFVDAVEAARTAAAARLDADGEVENLRCELAGTSPATRANYFPVELQTPRLLAALPSSWLFEINVGWPVGDSDFRARGERLIEFSKLKPNPERNIT